MWRNRMSTKKFCGFTTLLDGFLEINSVRQFIDHWQKCLWKVSYLWIWILEKFLEIASFSLCPSSASRQPWYLNCRTCLRIVLSILIWSCSHSPFPIFITFVLVLFILIPYCSTTSFSFVMMFYKPFVFGVIARDSVAWVISMFVFQTKVSLIVIQCLFITILCKINWQNSNS